MTSCARKSMPPRMIVMPGEGAVWPAIVRKGSVIVERGAAEVDHPADLEHDDPRTFRLDRCLERAGPVGVEIGDADDQRRRARPPSRQPSRQRPGTLRPALRQRRTRMPAGNDQQDSIHGASPCAGLDTCCPPRHPCL
jgi:hypothetical protein